MFSSDFFCVFFWLSASVLRFTRFSTFLFSTFLFMCIVLLWTGGSLTAQILPPCNCYPLGQNNLMLFLRQCEWCKPILRTQGIPLLKVIFDVLIIIIRFEFVLYLFSMLSQLNLHHPYALNTTSTFFSSLHWLRIIARDIELLFIIHIYHSSRDIQSKFSLHICPISSAVHSTLSSKFPTIVYHDDLIKCSSCGNHCSDNVSSGAHVRSPER